MKRTTVVVGLVGTVLLAMRSVELAHAADAGATPPAPPVPKPSRELAQLDFFRGKWTCAGKQFRTPFGPEHTFQGSSEVSVAADGFWHLWLYQEERSAVHLGVKVQGMWGWDAASKHFVRASGDSAGQWETGTSSGFEGDTLRWMQKSSGPLGTFDIRSIFTKQGDRQWSHTLDFRMKDGDFVHFQEVTCKKQ